MFLTIFTPTYNRGYIIENAYRSLKRQTFKDFEWLIVDDGSTDNTTAIVQKFIDQSPDMNIRYIKIEHNGKHFAINKSYEEAKGYFYFSLDSGDELYAPETLQLLHDRWEALSASQKNELSGISAYFVDTQGNILGHRFDGPLIIDLELYKQIVFEHKYSLNTPGMIKTNILRKVFFTDIKDTSL